MNTLLYFAYGSNMSSKRLQARVPSAKPVCIGILDEHSLRFHKRSHDGSAKCDAFKTGNSAEKVIGVIFTIDEAEKPTLDRAEGLGNGYDIKQVNLHLPDGNRISAFTYYATDIDDSLLPYPWYKNHVLQGALEHGLPSAYIEQIKAVQIVMDPDHKRNQREIAIHT